MVEHAVSESGVAEPGGAALKRALTALLLVASLPLLAAGRTTPLTYGPSPGLVSNVRIASNARGFVTSWQAGEELFAAAADSAGVRRGVVATWIGSGATPFAVQQVLSFGENFVITWTDLFGVQRAVEVAADLQFVRRFTLPATGRVAWNGSVFAIVSEKVVIANRDGSFINASALDRDGNYRIDIVPQTDGFVVVTWGDGVLIQRLDSQGVARWRRALAPGGFVFDAAQQRTSAAAVASNGTTAAVAWMRTSQSATSDNLYLTTIASSGDVTTTELPLGAGRSAIDYQGLAIAARGNGFVVVSKPGFKQGNSSAFTGPQIAHIASGGVSGPFEIGDLDAIASNGNVDYAATDLAGSGFSGSRLIGGPLRIEAFDQWQPEELSIVAHRQANLQLASDGSGFLETWLDHSRTDGTRSILSVDRDALAHETSENPITLNVVSDIGAVASNRDIQLVVWNDAEKLLGRRYSRLGTPLDASPFVIREGWARDLALSSDGDRFLLAGSDGRTILGLFVSPLGAVTTPVRLANEPGLWSTTANPRLAWNGREFLLTWDVGYPGSDLCCDPTPPGSRVVRVSRDGPPIDAEAVILPPANHLQPTNTRVASDGRGFLVTSDSNATTGRYLHDESGAVVIEPEFTIFPWIGRPTSAISFDGTDFVVAIGYGFRAQSWVATVHVSASGQPGPRYFTETGRHPSPAIASDILGHSLVAVTETRDGVGIPRVRTFAESELQQVTPPAAPVITSAVPVGNGLTILWTPSGIAPLGYVVETRESRASAEWVASQPITSMSFTLSYRGDIQSVRVRAFDVGGLSEASAAVAIPFAPRTRAVRR